MIPILRGKAPSSGWWARRETTVIWKKGVLCPLHWFKILWMKICLGPLQEPLFIVLGWGCSSRWIVDPFFSPFLKFAEYPSALLCAHIYYEKWCSALGGFWALLPSAMGEILQRSQCKTCISPHVDSQVLIFKDIYGYWMHKPLPKHGLWGFHGTCANACCDAGSLCSDRSFLQEV